MANIGDRYVIEIDSKMTDKHGTMGLACTRKMMTWLYGRAMCGICGADMRGEEDE